mmetsp:Transcript_32894/g.48667  ORF Transcript_32894/g.48667 Transcript_32894/m.48667 type:complete len:553 (+) Transcript_32894:204-1862(+)
MKLVPGAILVAAISHTVLLITAEVSVERESRNLRKRQRNHHHHSEDDLLQQQQQQEENNLAAIATTTRIVGGTDAAIDAYPFYVKWGGCGASLLSAQWVLTAAHCNVIPYDWLKINQSRKYGNQGRGTINYISRRVPHPQYDPSTVNNDFMLLKLENPVDVDVTTSTDDDSHNSVGPNFIDLNFNSTLLADNDALKVIGFGKLESGGGGSPQELQEVVVRYIPTNECNANGKYGGDVIDETMFCAGVDEGGKDSCQGDSGGPIFIETTTSNDGLASFTQVGVVSWGQGCAEAEFPGVYARISGVSDWIKDTVCDDDDDEEDDTNNINNKPPFCNSGGGGPPPPVPSPTPGNNDNDNQSLVKVQLRITFDQFPDETSWKFLQNNQVVASGSGYLAMPGDVEAFTYHLHPGPTDFEIRDTHGDGICCAYGRGDYQIVALLGNDDGGDHDDDDDEVLQESEGEYNVLETKSFTVPNTNNNDGNNSDNNDPPTPPTPGVICEDSPSQEFLVNNDIGLRGCEWLSLNTGKFSYLCTFFAVAVKCKVTCDVCSYFVSS